jgi:cytochrome c-type biogenesis protein CcmE
MKRNTRFLVGALLLVGAVAYLMYTGVRQTAVYYLTIEEFQQRHQAFANEGVRIAGRVEVGSVARKMTPKGEEIVFRLGNFPTDTNPGAPVPVYFVGIKPDMFKDGGGTDVIVEGTYRDGTLYAQSVLTSCPSKYEAETTSAAR